MDRLTEACLRLGHLKDTANAIQENARHSTACCLAADCKYFLTTWWVWADLVTGGKKRTDKVDGVGSQFTVSKKSQYHLWVLQILAASICSSLVFVFGDWKEDIKKKVPIHLMLEQ